MMTLNSISLAFLQRLALSCHQIFIGFRGEVFCLVMARFRFPTAFSQWRQRYWKRHEAFQLKFQTTGLFKKAESPKRTTGALLHALGSNPERYVFRCTQNSIANITKDRSSGLCPLFPIEHSQIFLHAIISFSTFHLDVR